ncbi:PLP-dependent aminotransferase family protein [Streptomyces sp. 549]|uniref:MocR-like pyridoxine biosynthesis transcription factor PdxR n=1 Tax=Streptomyces sp. 549 TaxID=3049076 RepID=UPI0024C2EB1B|nr:PLP-dependent aminotransferase family protein [Streptomyces sp. 549]MDK1476915.1 PLP-dependent aminotransferase family protein [Streptomyces sp. 549]
MNRSKDGLDEGSTTGADFLQLHLADAPTGGRADWLTDRLRGAVADGRLPAGSRLPPSRVLAAELGISRGVVTEAYRRLTEDGHVVGRGRRGTVVVAAPTGPPAAIGLPAPTRAANSRVATSQLPTSQVTVPAAQDLFGITPGADIFERYREAPARIDLSPGLPDLSAFPRAAWLRAERALLGTLSASELGYGDPRGAPALRRAVAHWLGRNRGIRADPDEVLVVSGTAQTLTLVGQVLHEDGVTEIAAEDPGSLGTRQHLSRQGLRILPVPVDAQGVRVDVLRDCGAPAVLLTPAHQFPTGVVLGGQRRRELASWADDSGGLVVEDDYDAEHRYDRAPVAALRSLLPRQVCYAGSISKILAPALRIGWALPPPHYREALTEAKRSADLGSAVLPQLVLAHLMESGELDRLLRHLRRHHRRRRDAMIASLRTHLPSARVHGAAAGLHLMVTFPTSRADSDLAAAALAEGVKTQPLSWHSLAPQPPGLVLGYAATAPDRIELGVSLLARALRRLP